MMLGIDVKAISVFTTALQILAVGKLCLAVYNWVSGSAENTTAMQGRFFSKYGSEDANEFTNDDLLGGKGGRRKGRIRERTRNNPDGESHRIHYAPGESWADDDYGVHMQSGKEKYRRLHALGSNMWTVKLSFDDGYEVVNNVLYLDDKTAAMANHGLAMRTPVLS